MTEDGGTLYTWFGDSWEYGKIVGRKVSNGEYLRL
jgi:hypothetical protein